MQKVYNKQSEVIKVLGAFLVAYAYAVNFTDSLAVLLVPLGFNAVETVEINILLVVEILIALNYRAFLNPILAILVLLINSAVFFMFQPQDGFDLFRLVGLGLSVLFVVLALISRATSKEVL